MPCSYSIHIKGKHPLNRESVWMERFCESLKEPEKRIILFRKRKMIPLTNKELKSHEDAKVCYIWGKYFIKYYLEI